MTLARKPSIKARERFVRKVKAWVKAHRHDPVRQQQADLTRKLKGHYHPSHRTLRRAVMPSESAPRFECDWDNRQGNGVRSVQLIELPTSERAFACWGDPRVLEDLLRRYVEIAAPSAIGVPIVGGYSRRPRGNRVWILRWLIVAFRHGCTCGSAGVSCANSPIHGPAPSS